MKPHTWNNVAIKSKLLPFSLFVVTLKPLKFNESIYSHLEMYIYAQRIAHIQWFAANPLRIDLTDEEKSINCPLVCVKMFLHCSNVLSIKCSIMYSPWIYQFTIFKLQHYLCYSHITIKTARPCDLFHIAQSLYLAFLGVLTINFISTASCFHAILKTWPSC